MRRLKVQQHQIRQVSFRLKSRDRALFETCVHALKNQNKDRAAICANEIAEVKKLIKFLYNVELAIERVFLRLETIRELSDIIIDLKPAVRLLQKVSKQLFEVMPDVSSELSKVNDVITETLHSTKVRTGASIIPIGDANPAGKEILEEASDFLEREMYEKLPEPPAAIRILEETPVRQMVALAATCSQVIGEETVESQERSSQDRFSFEESEVQEVSLEIGKTDLEEPDLEEVLLEYVKKSKGEVDLTQCSL
ncbi:hypothetical protein GTO27_11760, partial [Candidatus Bathyarchaeota archaeon]|nr:hypothetical protein [Candidatus Bathyarchaeota archaeon]